MERLNKIFAEWAKDDKKTELASEKVELASKYDFTQFKKEFDNEFKKYRSDYRAGINAAKKSTDNYSGKLSEILKKSENLVNEFGDKAEELGLDYRNSKPYKQFQDIKKILLSAASNAKEKQTEISKLM